MNKDRSSLEASHVPSFSIKSRLLPPTKFEAKLEQLVESLPRQAIKIGLTAHQGILPIEGTTEDYRLIRDDAAFRVEFDGGAPISGYYYMEAALTRHTGNRESHLIIEIGNSGERFEIPIASNLRGSIREVFHIPEGTTAVFWRPCRAAGYISQSELLVNRITAGEALLRQLHRVWLDRKRLTKVLASLRANRFPQIGDLYIGLAQARIDGTSGSNYAEFLRRSERLTFVDGLILARCAKKKSLPKISLVALFDTNSSARLEETIQSIQGQTYKNWELIVVVSELVEQRLIDKAYRYTSDRRITVIELPGNPTRAHSLNKAILVASGVVVTIITNAVIFRRYALQLVAQRFTSSSSISIIYTDEDKIHIDATRVKPSLKPDWNPDLLLSTNYIGENAFFRRRLLEEIGGYSEQFPSAETYDLLLRTTQRLSGDQIHHLPAILVSRCIEPTESTTTRERCANAELACLAAFLRGTGATVKPGLVSNSHRIKFPVPNDPPLVSIIIPTRDKVEILRACISSIRQKTDYPSWEIIVVDNQSKEGLTTEYLRGLTEDRRIRVLAFDYPFNYSALNNFAVRHAKGEFICLMNNDVEVIAEEWLTEMVGLAARPDIGAVGAKLLYSNGLVQHAGVFLGIGGVAGHGHRFLPDSDGGYENRASLIQNISAVTAACLVVKKTRYQQIGGLNEADLAVAFNDVDFCLKLKRAGYRNVFTPFARLYHHESLSRGKDDTPEKQEIFQKEYQYMRSAWSNEIEHDFAYNKNLSMQFEDFSLSNRSGAIKQILRGG